MANPASFSSRSSLTIVMALSAALFATGCLGTASGSSYSRKSNYRSYSTKSAKLTIATGSGSIYVDGRFKGYAPKSMYLTPGKHSVRIRINGRNHYKTVWLRSGKNEILYMKSRRYRSSYKPKRKSGINMKATNRNGIVSLNKGWYHGVKIGQKGTLSKFGKKTGRFMVTKVYKYSARGIVLSGR